MWSSHVLPQVRAIVARTVAALTSRGPLRTFGAEAQPQAGGFIEGKPMVFYG